MKKIIAKSMYTLKKQQAVNPKKSLPYCFFRLIFYSSVLLFTKTGKQITAIGKGLIKIHWKDTNLRNCLFSPLQIKIVMLV